MAGRPTFARYLFVADTYAELPSQDTLLNTVSGSYQRAFTPHLRGLLKISNQWLYTDQSLREQSFYRARSFGCESQCAIENLTQLLPHSKRRVH